MSRKILKTISFILLLLISISVFSSTSMAKSIEGLVIDTILIKINEDTIITVEYTDYSRSLFLKNTLYNYLKGENLVPLIYGVSSNNKYIPYSEYSRQLFLTGRDVSLALNQSNPLTYDELEKIYFIEGDVIEGIDPHLIPIIVQASAITEIVTIGIGEVYNLVENLVFSPSDAIVTYSSNDVTGVYSNLIVGELTGKKQGRVIITAVVSKEGYISKTVNFGVLVAPVLLEWTTPATVEKNAGEEETIVVNMSLLEGVHSIDAVAVYMMWEKNIESVWQAVNTNDIAITTPLGILTGEDGLYKLSEGILTDVASINISSDVTFKNAGEYKLTVYAIKSK